jgi:GH25 family lysozyme M1 (1,4-beta-N-acetylmuramidase)
MSKDAPIWGVDISAFQEGIDLAQVAREGYEFCVVKASEGPYGDGTFTLNPLYGTQIDDAQRAGMLTGAYHFLVETPAAAQVDLFLNTVGEVSGKLIMVDYEAYPEPFQFLSPTMATLEAFVTELRNRIGDHPILVYAGQGYWESPPPNGSIRHLNVTTWDAFYPLGSQAGLGSVLYEQIKDLGWGERWGEQEPKFWQFSANGMVAGMEIDVNAFSGTREELYALAVAESPDGEPEPAQLRVDENKWLRNQDDASVWVEGYTNASAAVNRSGYLYLISSAAKRIEPPVNPDGSWIERHPTRYNVRRDVLWLARSVEMQYDVSWNTYHDHPEGYGRDADTVDFWGLEGRGYPINPTVGRMVFARIFNDPNPPLIDWTIWQGWIWSYQWGWSEFIDDGTGLHYDHIHVTFR